MLSRLHYPSTPSVTEAPQASTSDMPPVVDDDDGSSVLQDHPLRLLETVVVANIDPVAMRPAELPPVNIPKQ